MGPLESPETDLTFETSLAEGERPGSARPRAHPASTLPCRFSHHGPAGVHGVSYVSVAFPRFHFDSWDRRRARGRGSGAWRDGGSGSSGTGRGQRLSTGRCRGTHRRGSHHRHCHAHPDPGRGGARSRHRDRPRHDRALGRRRRRRPAAFPRGPRSRAQRRAGADDRGVHPRRRPGSPHCRTSRRRSSSASRS